MPETHPFDIFVPPQMKYLLLGSFTTKEALNNPTYDWYYGTKRNHFWPILRVVYNLSLATKEQKQELFARLHLGLGDIIFQCERKSGNNLDVNLNNIVYNTRAIDQVLAGNIVEKIFFSSRFVEVKFKVNFKDLINKYPNVVYVTLPSPSPRYAAMTRAEKIRKYTELLPKLN